MEKLSGVIKVVAFCHYFQTGKCLSKLLKADEIPCPGVTDRGTGPLGMLPVELVEDMEPAIEEEEPVRIIDPPLRCGEVVAGPLGYLGHLSILPGRALKGTWGSV